MRPSKTNQLALGLLTTIALVACDGAKRVGADFSDDLEQAPSESFEELAARTAVPSEEDRYLVEGDMLLSYEALTRYYENRYLQDKANVAVARNTASGKRFYAIRGPAVEVGNLPGSGIANMNIRYCMTGGWGGVEAPLATVQASMDSAAAAWASIAAVKFNHVTSADGAGCTQAIVGSTVDFVVKPNVGKPNASYAWWTYAQVSELAVGANASYEAILLHELGHVLGFDHEFYHDGSGLTGAGCLAAGTAPPYSPPIAGFTWANQADITAYDNKSIMGYYSASNVANCNGGMPVGWKLSPTDAAACRIIYGSPHFWPVVIANGIMN